MASSMSKYGKKGFEWDLNDWKWDGDLFLATPLNGVQSECRAMCSEEIGFEDGREQNGEVEKRRRIVAVEDDEECDNGGGDLSLDVGGNDYRRVVEANLANWEERDVKRSKVQGGSLNRSPCCQVDGCEADLSEAKPYHRRHKACEMHSKASSAMVNGVLMRFCQQCSRFHLLQEFDEGKRSCRRRLAGHNKRRRKTQPDASATVNSVIDDQASSYLLVSLLRILSNLHSGNSDHSNQQDLLSHLLRSLATLAGTSNADNLSVLLQASQDSQKLGISAGTPSEVANNLISTGVPVQSTLKPLPSSSKRTCIASIQEPSPRPVHDIPLKGNTTDASLDSTEERIRLKDFDLNNAYSDTENCIEGNEDAANPAYLGSGSPIPPSCLVQNSHHSSPPLQSGNSDSASMQSLSSSNGDAQCRTDKIVFKLFGKDPSDFPLVLRSQILDWLSHSPTDVESYIRPGCIILTIYLRLAEPAWEELSKDLISSLNRFLDNVGDSFWRTGWVYARVQHEIAFIYNGKILLNAPKLLESPYHCKILSVTPVAVAVSSRVNFTVKGLNLSYSMGRFLCAFEGKYLVQEITQTTDNIGEQKGSHSIRISCSLPNEVGRGFIEVDDHGLSNCFFPFIVAEDDVCSEIRALENVIDIASFDIEATDIKTRALNFLNEMGWLLHRSQLRLTSAQANSNYYLNAFSLTRFKWLMAFAMEREWCAVVKKLLDLLFRGSIDLGGHSPKELVLSEDMLHSAVRKNCKSMVEFLLRYRPDTDNKECRDNSYLFRPDVPGPSNMTPLHLAASLSSTNSVLDALTNDPGQVGLKAWKNARDITGFTPEDYARSRGYESYILLVQKKIDKQTHVVLDIPASLSTAHGTSYKQADIPKCGKLAGFELEQIKLRPSFARNCNLCSHQQLVARHSLASRSMLYRPAMLSMVGIAAVCVCVGLIFKGPPEVGFGIPPCIWERLAYGSS